MNTTGNKSDFLGPIKAVVLDWAGTTVDHGCLGPTSVFLEVFRKKGIELNLAEVRAFMGLKKIDHIRALCGLESVERKWLEIFGQKPSEDDIEAMHQDLEKSMIGCVVRFSGLIPGLLETVEHWRKKGIKIGSTTGYTRPIMDVLADHAKALGYEPDCLITSSEVPNGRPYPWMCYLNAINLDVYPMKAMVKIGDTVSDIQEGLNAGMWTIGLTTTGNEMGLSFDELNLLTSEKLAQKQAAIEKRFKAAGAHFVVSGIKDCPEVMEIINQKLAQGHTPLA